MFTKIQLILIVSLMALTLGFVSASFDAELDSLAARFSSSLGGVGGKLGVSAEGQLSPNEADSKMRELYANVENVLIEARQRSANLRSSIISSEIDTLRL